MWALEKHAWRTNQNPRVHFSVSLDCCCELRTHPFPYSFAPVASCSSRPTENTPAICRPPQTLKYHNKQNTYNDMQHGFSRKCSRVMNKISPAESMHSSSVEAVNLLATIWWKSFKKSTVWRGDSIWPSSTKTYNTNALTHRPALFLNNHLYVHICTHCAVCCEASWAGSCWFVAVEHCCLLHTCSLDHYHFSDPPSGSLLQRANVFSFFNFH